MYKVLVPKYVPAGFTQEGYPQFNVRWNVVGHADSLQEAKKITKYPVLELV